MPQGGPWYWYHMKRLMKEASTHRILRATLVTIAAPEPQVIHSVFGIN